MSPHLAYLENLVRERSGSALWFRRDAGAAAEPLDRIPGKRFPGCCCGKTGPIPGHGTLSQIIWTGKRLDC